MFDGHGDDIYRYGDKIKHNFSSNIFQGFDHSELCRWLGKQVSAVANYPSPEPDDVEALIAEYHGVLPESVMLTAGATEAIYLIAEMWRGCRSFIAEPTFSEYEDACRLYDHRLQFGDFNIDTILEADTNLIWLCNPNNPTGQQLDVEDIKRLMRRFEQFIVIDASYAEYSPLPYISPMQVMLTHNCVMIKSLTKSFAVPGLRLGYVIASPAVIRMLKRLCRPWAVGGLERRAVAWLLEHKDMYKINLPMLLSEARRVADALRSMGIEVGESVTNFMLCRLPHGNAADLKAWLIENHGILIRDASNFRGLTEAHFRIAVQRPEENDLLIKALKQWPVC